MSAVAAQAFTLLIALAYHIAVALWCMPQHFRCCLLATFKKSCTVPDGWKTAHFYEGEVFHARRKPVEHELRYPVRVAFINLQQPPSWFKPQQRQHLTQKLAQQLAGTDGPVMLLTNPISAGYHQNPICVYYCYSSAWVLQVCIAEVTNTPWGERVTFLFNPDGSYVPKGLHVSPMMDMQNTWYLQTTDPLKSKLLKLVVNASHPENGSYFNASFAGRPSKHLNSPNEHATLSILFRYGYQPHRIAFWIYIHAFMLLWKGVSLFDRPSATYRQQAELKAKELGMRKISSSGDHFIWRDAQKPVWRH